MGGDLHIYQPVIYPKDATNNHSKFAANRLGIHEVNWINGWWYKNIEMREVFIKNPRMILYQPGWMHSMAFFSNSSQKTLWDYNIKKVSIQDGEAKGYNDNGKVMGRVGEIDVSFSGLSVREGMKTIKVAKWTTVKVEDAHYFVNERRYKLAVKKKYGVKSRPPFVWPIP